MRVVLTRESVCMGDDAEAPHETAWEVDGGATLADVLEQAAGCCPHLRRGCWIAHLGYNRPDGAPLALLAPQWPRPRVLLGADAQAELGAHSDELEIFWGYRSGADPEALWRQLGGGQVHEPLRSVESRPGWLRFSRRRRPRRRSAA
ncbi:hypothetical protein [Kitasatospora sp. LaBMicrA B282]|uniref:hypothetical protein n=1 Tax=Kitasatospora sp. LaBMicrA B282 TaxID=3420949 RepID=UPI003D10AE46